MPIFSRLCIRNKDANLIVILAGLTIALAVLSMAIGPSQVGFRELLLWLQGMSTDSTGTILLFIRLPRTLGAIAAGGALAVSGLLLQTVMQNPLASPGIIGVNAGAGLFVVLAASLLPPLFWLRGTAAFAGAMSAAMMIWLIAARIGASKTTVVLSGIAISSLLSALIDAVITVFPVTVTDKTAFFIGGFSSASLRQVLTAVPFVAVALLISALMSRRLDLLPMGDEVAASLGLNVKKCRFLAILCASLLAAAAVSIAGLLGFVGLIVPHMARKLTNRSMRTLLPVTLFLGINLTLLCDILSRVLLAPYELSAGIPLSLIGAPFFLKLILSRRRTRHD